MASTQTERRHWLKSRGSRDLQQKQQRFPRPSLFREIQAMISPHVSPGLHHCPVRIFRTSAC